MGCYVTISSETEEVPNENEPQESKAELLQGTIIRGRWNKSTYIVERKLGEGANGHVYLVKGDKGDKLTEYALKVGLSTSDLQSEINLLKKLAPIVDKKPFFIDADDYMDGEDICSFYVMQYVEGVSMSEFIEIKGNEWLYLASYYLLKRLCDTHKRGFAFCDVKPTNAVVSTYGQVELIDYGGATPFGKSVRQFTELYDRGYWNAGSRTADIGYDLFAFSVVFMQLAGATLPGKGEVELLLPQNRSKTELFESIKLCPPCHIVAPVLHSMINGTYADSSLALEDWKKCIHKIGIAPKQSIHIPWLGGLAVAAVIIMTISIYTVFN
jgi:serine/threonine protein kinase